MYVVLYVVRTLSFEYGCVLSIECCRFHVVICMVLFVAQSFVCCRSYSVVVFCRLCVVVVCRLNVVICMGLFVCRHLSVVVCMLRFVCCVLYVVFCMLLLLLFLLFLSLLSG